MRASRLAFTSRLPRVITGRLKRIFADRAISEVGCMRFRKNRISIRKMRNRVHIFFIHMHNLYAFGVVFFPLLATYLSDSVHLDTLRSPNVRIWASIFRNGHSTRNIQIL